MGIDEMGIDEVGRYRRDAVTSIYQRIMVVMEQNNWNAAREVEAEDS